MGRFPGLAPRCTHLLTRPRRARAGARARLAGRPETRREISCARVQSACPGNTRACSTRSRPISGAGKWMVSHISLHSRGEPPPCSSLHVHDWLAVSTCARSAKMCMARGDHDPGREDAEGTKQKSTRRITVGSLTWTIWRASGRAVQLWASRSSRGLSRRFHFLSVLPDFSRICAHTGRFVRLLTSFEDHDLIASPDAFALSDAFDAKTPAVVGVSSFTFFL